MEPRQALPPGTMVYGADGEPIGTVESADDSYVMVETGEVPPVLYVPVSAIVETREDGAYLSITGADARHQGWAWEPENEEMPEDAEELGSDYSAVQAEDSMDDDYSPIPEREETAPSLGRSAGTGNDLTRPSGITGPDTNGSP